MTRPILSRIDAVADSNFSYWHSATFNNDGTKICSPTSGAAAVSRSAAPATRRSWGADAIFRIEEPQDGVPGLLQAPRTANTLRELRCSQRVADPDSGPRRHGAGVVSGRDLGLRLDRSHAPDGNRVLRSRPRGLHPDGERRVMVGVLVQRHDHQLRDSRGLDIFELKPSALISANEIAAAKSVHFDEFNTQGQPSLVWPTTFALARAYVDQLERSKGLSGSRISAVRSGLESAEHASGGERRDALTQLATQLDGDAQGSSDGAKVRLLAGTVRNLATTSTAAASN